MALSLFFQSIIILFIFTAVYKYLYRWNKQFLLNRIYLILTVLLSIIIPLLSFDVFPYNKIISTVEKNNNPIIPLTDVESTDWVLVIYLQGVSLSFAFLVYRLIKIIELIRRTNFIKAGKYKIATGYSTTFSFLKYIFISNLNDTIVVNHEKAHVSHYHTIDIFIIELSKCILWFNPFVYIMKYYMQENHEFEADFIAMEKKNIDDVTMAEYLLIYSKKHIANQRLITNNFFSLTKNRIKMLAKNKSSRKITYALVIPLFLVILSAFTFKSYPVYITQDGQVVRDTLIPGYYYVTDTIVSFDPNTYAESYRIVKSKITMDEYINSLNLSGKMSSRIDTVPYYDPDTKEESLMVYKIKYPYELRLIFHKFTWKQQEAIIKNYGSQTKEVVKE